MIEVRLHGALARDFGRVWHLDIATPAEAVRAIECGRKGFRAAIMKLERAGMVFRVRTPTHDYGNDDVGATLGAQKRLDIIPVVAGASAGFRFVLGAVLIAAAYMVPGIGPVAGNFMVTTGISLMLGAVTEWLTPKPKRDDFKNVQSWTISGPTNTADQGQPVPVIYGEVLTGGYPISAGIAAAQMSPGGSLAPTVTIGGNFNPNVWTNAGGLYTLVLQLSASPFNLDEPLSFAWSYTGFAAAAARRLVIPNQATMRLELDYLTTAGGLYTDSGNVSVSLTGRDSSGTSLNPGSPVTVSASQPITTAVNAWVWEGGA